MPTIAYIALGSNLGDRHAALDAALARLGAAPGVIVRAVSTYHETDPVGGPPGQGRYLNAAAEIVTDLPPDDLLARLLTIEAELGRVRSERNAPRTLDLDLLLYGNLVRAGPGPIVPHPRMHERLFVLGPLAEIAADVVHPRFGLTVRRLRDDLQPRKPPGRPLAGLRAMVTGATSGIGRAIAEQFAEAGAWVIVHGRSAERAEEVCAAARCHEVAAEVLLAELRGQEACDRLLEDGWELWDGLDLWVNNAGADILTGAGPTWSFAEKLEALWAVDVRATVRLSRAVGALMKARGQGVILNLGWDQAATGMAGDSGQLFATVKAAVMSFSRSLALTLAPEVRVNCVAPGWIRTAWGEQASAAWQQRVLRETPLGRWGRPEDVAAAAVWLASPAAAFVTGQTLRVNGGAVGG